MYPIGAIVFALFGTKFFTSSNAGGWFEKFEMSYSRTRSGFAPVVVPSCSSSATNRFRLVLTAIGPRKSLSGKTLGGKFLIVVMALVAVLKAKQLSSENELCETCFAQNVSPAPNARPS